MSHELLALFKRHVRAKPGPKLTTDLLKASLGFLNKNANHAEFFGGHLVGTPPIRFVDEDRESLYQALEVESPEDLQIELRALSVINPEFKTESDIFNQLIGYTVHLYEKSGLPSKQVNQVQRYTLQFLYGKLTSGQMARSYKFPADPLIAQNVFESLDDRTYLKKYGSWTGMFDARIDDILDGRSIHRRAIDKYEDEPVKEMIADISSRLLKMVIRLNVAYYDAHGRRDRVITSSKLSEVDGEQLIKDTKSGPQGLVRDIDRIARDPRDFIKDELLDITTDVLQADNRRNLLVNLEHFVDNYSARKDYQDLLQSIVVYLIRQVREDRLDLSDIPGVVNKVQSIYRSSRTKRKDVLAIRNKTDEIVARVTPRLRKQIHVGTKIALFIYIVIRILTVNTYRAGVSSGARPSNQN